ncbi:hypothetical protein AMTR_s00080p00087650 [Amborella trichopoda]|uniref:Uncharacterized protein n=1 Tax=Amborella trichopoda TaxID=13333 RepID=W1PBC3_AMBTC|nr:hypothetical protein AMTR_s00080p00087650 [Amborella trichopoda]
MERRRAGCVSGRDPRRRQLKRASRSRSNGLSSTASHLQPQTEEEETRDRSVTEERRVTCQL